MSKQKVFATRSNFPENSVKLLKEKFDVEFYCQPTAIARDALIKGIKGKDALFCVATDKIDEEVIVAAGPQLKVIATVSLGYEHINIEECKKRNIVVCNGPNNLSVGAVAEVTVALMLAIGRNIIKASQAIKNGEWSETWTSTWYLGRGLMGSVVGIIGMGRIGEAVLDRVLPFGVAQVVYYDVQNLVHQAEEKGARLRSFEDLLRVSDFVVVTCNLTPQSKGSINAKAFSLMKSSSVFINTSRGGVVDQEALYDALKNKTIKAAGIDVMYPEPLPKDHKLLDLDNVVVLPHIAGAETAALNRLADLAAENIISVLDGKKPKTFVF